MRERGKERWDDKERKEKDKEREPNLVFLLTVCGEEQQ